MGKQCPVIKKKPLTQKAIIMEQLFLCAYILFILLLYSHTCICNEEAKGYSCSP